MPSRILIFSFAERFLLFCKCAETHELGEELIASYLYQVHLYDWLESNDYGRFLVDNDL